VRLLVIEDDDDIARPLVGDLRRQGHVVDAAADGESGLALAAATEHEVVLLDVTLPGMDGIEVCRRLRRGGSTAMILMLTARDGVSSKVRALDAGADDYVVKPFDLDELSARIRALARRHRAPRETVLRHGTLQLDVDGRAFLVAGAPVTLTRSEHAIVEALMRHPHRVQSPDALLDRIAGLDAPSGAATVKSHITNIRRKMRAAGARGELIVNVYGSGYRLAEP
jgi:DNA-binding response OmpR family regulator